MISTLFYLVHKDNRIWDLLKRTECEPLKSLQLMALIAKKNEHRTCDLKGCEHAVVSGLAYDKNTDNANTMLASNHEAVWCIRHLECSTTNLVLFITKICHAFCFVSPRIPNNSIRKVGLLDGNDFAAFLVHNLQRCTYFAASTSQILACVCQHWLLAGWHDPEDLLHPRAA